MWFFGPKYYLTVPLTFFVFFLACLADAEGIRSKDSPAPSGNVAVPLNFSLFDSPYNSQHGYSSPSMHQSLELGIGAQRLLHLGLGQVLPISQPGWAGFLSRLGVVLVDFQVVALPLGVGWIHEEWHRAVMKNRGINSHNGVNDFGSGSIVAVNNETDAELTRLKAEHPADQIRLSAAGLESSHALVTMMEKDDFFRGSSTFDYGTLWLAQAGASSYLSGCASVSSDEKTRKIESKEGVDIAKRDFIGLDCTGWVYDLHHPIEPFDARGVHPSGVGINRYKSFSDLSPREKKYLKIQRDLSLLNFVDPQLFGLKGFAFLNPLNHRNITLNGALGHDLTPSGQALSLKLFVKDSDYRLPYGANGFFATIYNYSNHARSFPGIEVEHRPLQPTAVRDQRP